MITLAPSIKNFYIRSLSHYNRLLPMLSLNKNMDQADQKIANLLDLIASQQDKAAFKVFYTTYQPKVFYYLLKTGLSQEQSLEITQEVMLKIWRNALQYDSSKGQVSTWVFTIVRNTHFDYLRKIAQDPIDVKASDIYPDDLANHAQEELEVLYQKLETKKAISSLSQEQQNVLNSIYGLGMSHSEYALKESIPIGTVKSRLRLAITQLKSMLEE